MNEFVKYLYLKLITAFVNYGKLFNEISKFNEALFSQYFIDSLDEFRKIYLEENMLDEKQVYNLRKLVNYIRENVKNNTYTEILNKLIISLNKTDFSNTTEYLMDNYVARFYGHTPGLLNALDVELYRDAIKFSAAKDYDYLLLLVIYSDEDFEKYKENVILDEYFLMSLNQIVWECENIDESKRFIERTRAILDENIKRISQVENKRVKKIIKKESKYYSKYL